MKSGNSLIYVINTPIGNLSDCSPRVIETLNKVDIIAAEDTRNALKLFQLLGVTFHGELISYFDHNERERSQNLIDRLIREELTLGLISDAGTPLVSDPGYHLLDKAYAHQIPVCPIPGPSAVTTLLSAAALPTGRFYFAGFPDKKTSVLQDEIKRWDIIAKNIIFFATKQSLPKIAHALSEHEPNAVLTIGRELTKKFEEIVKIPTEQFSQYWQDGKKGEFVVAVTFPDSDNKEEQSQMDVTIEKLAQTSLSTKDIQQVLSHFPIGKKDLYQKILGLRAKKSSSEE